MPPRRPVKSPIQPRTVDSMAQLAKHMGDFVRMFREVMQAKEEIIAKLSAIQKGERGPQGFAGRDGKNADPDEILRKVLAQIPDSQTIVKKVLAQIPTPRDGRDGKTPDVEVIAKKVKSSLSTKDISGLDQTISAFKTQLDNRGGYIHGGGDTVGAGTGIAITDVNGTKIISATGGGAALTAETPQGDVDGSNLIFTVTNEPVFVEIDGTIRVNGYGYSYAAGVITVDALMPPSQSIVSFYNA